MLKKSVLDKTYFIPKKHMLEVLEVIKNGAKKYSNKQNYCSNNLYLLQRSRLNTIDYSVYSRVNWFISFTLACHKAVYAHDWDKLLYLLVKFPRWKFGQDYRRHIIFDSIYTRYLTMLLMYHPSSKEQGLLCQYLHMTWGCRTEQDQKAILKVLLHLPKKLPRPLWNLKKKEKEEIINII